MSREIEGWLYLRNEQGVIKRIISLKKHWTVDH